MFSGSRSADLPEITIRGHQLPLERTLRYLGVMVDRNLTFSAHVSSVAERAVAVATAVERLMLNMGGPFMAK